MQQPTAPQHNADDGPRRAHPRRRRLTKIGVILIVVLAVLIGLDRLAEVVAARNLAATIQSSQHLSSRPHVSIGGFPFLTQVVRGRYDDVSVSAGSPIGENGIDVNNAAVHLRGVTVNLSDAFHGTVSNVPVQSGTGTAVITYPQLNTIVRRYAGTLGSQLTISGAAPGHARATGPFGLSVAFTARVHGGKLIVTPDPAELRALPSVLQTGINNALAKPIPLPPFPFHVRLDSAHLNPHDIQLRASAHNSIFPVR